MEYAISVDEISFSYFHTKQMILHDISLKIPKGTVYGLLGRNGSGKSTLLNILSTLLLPMEYRNGSIMIDGQDVQSGRQRIRSETSLIAGGERGLYYNLTGLDNLRFFGSLYGLSGEVLSRQIEKVSKSVGIDVALGKLVRKYSLGMKQRLHIAAGLLNNPTIVFMDEPTNGLDVEVTADVLDIIESLKGEGKTVLLTTHHLQDAERVCDEVSILNHGKIIFSKTKADLKKIIQMNSFYSIDFRYLDMNELIRAKSLTRLNQNGKLIRVFNGNMDSNLKKVIALFPNSIIDSIHYERPSLEDLYLQEMKKSDSTRD